MPDLPHHRLTVGAIGEAKLVQQLLLSGFQVFRPVVDAGVDYLAITPNGAQLRIQAKARSGDYDRDFGYWQFEREQEMEWDRPTHLFLTEVHLAADGGKEDRWWLLPVTEGISEGIITPPTEKSPYRVNTTKENLHRLEPYLKETGIEKARCWGPAAPHASAAGGTKMPRDTKLIEIANGDSFEALTDHQVSGLEELREIAMAKGLPILHRALEHEGHDDLVFRDEYFHVADRGAGVVYTFLKQARPDEGRPAAKK